MRTLTKYAAAAVLTGALAMLAATPSEARSYRHHGAAVAKGAVDRRSGEANGPASGSYAYAPLGPGRDVQHREPLHVIAIVDQFCPLQ